EHSDDDNNDVEKDDKDGDADDEGDDHINEDAEMTDAEVEESDKGKEKVTDAVKEEAKRLQKQRMIPRRPNSLHQAQSYMYL
ncbi:hypothetical protein Tco_0326354, partial [Tanacetum coccineum]